MHACLHCSACLSGETAYGFDASSLSCRVSAEIERQRGMSHSYTLTLARDRRELARERASERAHCIFIASPSLRTRLRPYGRTTRERYATREKGTTAHTGSQMESWLGLGDNGPAYSAVPRTSRDLHMVELTFLYSLSSTLYCVDVYLGGGARIRRHIRLELKSAVGETEFEMRRRLCKGGRGAAP